MKEIWRNERIRDPKSFPLEEKMVRRPRRMRWR